MSVLDDGRPLAVDDRAGPDRPGAVGTPARDGRRRRRGLVERRARACARPRRQRPHGRRRPRASSAAGSRTTARSTPRRSRPTPSRRGSGRPPPARHAATRRSRPPSQGARSRVQLEHVMAVDWEEPLVPPTRALRRTCSCGRAGHVRAPGRPRLRARRPDRPRAVAAAASGAAARSARSRRLPSRSRSSRRTRSGKRDRRPSWARARPLPTAAVLKRLGKSGIQVGAQDLAEVLERAYASFAASGRR